MDKDLMLIISYLDPNDRGEIDFILDNPDLSDEEKNVVIGDIVNSLVLASPEGKTTDE
jgi:hypothetical protein